MREGMSAGKRKAEEESGLGESAPHSNGVVHGKRHVKVP